MVGTGVPRRKKPVKPPQPQQAGSLQDRHHSRFAVSLPVRCSKATGRPSAEWRGRTANVGGGGLAVELPTRLRPHTRLAIEIRTAIGPMRVEAEVMWTRRLARPSALTRHGLCLAGRSEVLDLPIHALLGEWLRAVARRAEPQRTPRSASPRRRRRLARR
jgi:hypothetical protein